MRDYFAEGKRWNLLDKMNKRIFETVEVEDGQLSEVEEGQLRILIDFFCCDVIVNEMMGNIEDTFWRYYYEDVNGSIKEILEEELTDVGVILKEISIYIKKEFDRLYWDCIVFGNGSKGLHGNENHIRKYIIEEMTANDFYMDLEVMYGTLYKIQSSLEEIKMNPDKQKIIVHRIVYELRYRIT